MGKFINLIGQGVTGNFYQTTQCWSYYCYYFDLANSTEKC